MSTSAAIFVKSIEDETYTGVQVKYDGYVKDGVGETLFNSYNTYALASQLVNYKKDIRCLNDSIEENDYFKDQIKVKIDKLDYYQMVNFGGNHDFIYLFEDNQWKVYHNGKFININVFLG